MAASAKTAIPDHGASAALDLLTCAVIGVDHDGRIGFLNAAACELLGIASAGAPLLALGAVAQPLLAAFERARAAQRSLTLRAQTLGPAGGSADIAVSLRADGGAILEIHRLLLDADTATVPRLSESLRGLAHEVKNPLAGIRGAAQLLRRRVHEPEFTHLADLIIGEADRLAALADRLLHASGKPHLTQVNLHEVAERARALIAAEAEAAVRLERDYDPSLPGLRADADRLLQLLLNLLRNALQAGATRVRVRTRAEHHVRIGESAVKLAARIEVCDDGHGVPEALRHRLFLPLVSARANGTGLGLALAQEIAREHGGQISYRSQPGDTMFALQLPLLPLQLEQAHG